MEQKEMLHIKATRVVGPIAACEISVSCTGDELLQVLTDVIVSISDANQKRFTVKNGFWLLLNDQINAELKERSIERNDS